MANSILVSEDNEDMLVMIYEWLEPLGYDLGCARDGKSGLKQAKEGNFDCIVLDIMLPSLDGMSLCEDLRKNGYTIPIIMLTARDTVNDRVKGLEAGADDYLVKPFALAELEARIKALIRRGVSNKKENYSNMCSYGPIECNISEHRVMREGIELRLSPTSFKILLCLVQNAPSIVNKEELENLLWGDDLPSSGALRMQIHELRKILDKPFAYPMLETVSHVGYRLKSNMDNS